ncbi:MAG: hypothetical protein WA823_21250 [Candidatus Acidiferrales bacterium]
MRIGAKYLAAIAATALMSLPVFARADSTTLVVDTPTQVGQTTLQPGQYEIRAEPNADHLTVLHNGKEVATAPVRWVQLNRKPSETEVMMSSGRVTEVEFSGKTEAAQLR